MRGANTTDTLRARDIIAGFDFGYVVDRAIAAGMTRRTSEIALGQLKAFLLACAEHPERDIVPQSAACDDLWHEFIVADTRAYFRFCEAVYGEYLHHNGVTVPAERMAAARTDSAGLFAAADCLREAAKADCLREAVKADCLREAKAADCLREAAKADCLREAKPADCLREAKAADCLREAAKADCLREAKPADCLREAKAADCLREAAKADCLREAKPADCLREARSQGAA
ncbi:hypothetical protein JHL17_23005 [Azospirillum sp. YIM B02556]|uniref:Uncharacterized protein n=1 Tax=Azospirillum endophyticum TaxID=2800326 RepID=A0ABS1FA17_9PROT|nr:hypothetical protein [Azospirillum endophyticum]MBK1840277.1 hypothetical protein [Azospirillum endophyticum]